MISLYLRFRKRTSSMLKVSGTFFGESNGPEVNYWFEAVGDAMNFFGARGEDWSKTTCYKRLNIFYNYFLSNMVSF